MHKRNIGILTERMPHKNSRCKEEAGAGEEADAGRREARGRRPVQGRRPRVEAAAASSMSGAAASGLTAGEVNRRTLEDSTERARA